MISILPGIRTITIQTIRPIINFYLFRHFQNKEILDQLLNKKFQKSKTKCQKKTQKNFFLKKVEIQKEKITYLHSIKTKELRNYSILTKLRK